MSEPISVELSLPGDDAVAVEWSAEQLAELGPGLALLEDLWRLRGEPNWDRLDSLRVLSARLADGRGLAIASLRPAGAAGHAEDVRAGLIGAGTEFEALDEVRFSTEYGADGRARRIGLELLTGGSELPLRLAGDAREASSASRDGLSHERIGFELRLGEQGGPALLEVLRAG